MKQEQDTSEPLSLLNACFSSHLVWAFNTTGVFLYRYTSGFCTCYDTEWSGVVGTLAETHRAAEQCLTINEVDDKEGHWTNKNMLSVGGRDLDISTQCRPFACYRCLQYLLALKTVLHTM